MNSPKPRRQWTHRDPGEDPNLSAFLKATIRNTEQVCAPVSDLDDLSQLSGVARADRFVRPAQSLHDGYNDVHIRQLPGDPEQKIPRVENTPNLAISGPLRWGLANAEINRRPTLLGTSTRLGTPDGQRPGIVRQTLNERGYLPGDGT